MSDTTKNEVMGKLRRRYETAGREHKSRLIAEAVGLFGYHPKAAIRALNRTERVEGPFVRTGRPREYDSKELLPVLREVWSAGNYPCSLRLKAMLPEWLRDYEADRRSVPGPVKERLLEASPRTLDRLLRPLRVEVRRPSLTRPGSLLRREIPIRGNVWEDDKAGWLEVDTVALCGGSVAGDFVWMVDAVDYHTTWVTVRPMWNRGREGTLAALMDIEQSLPFPLLGLDSDNGGEFINLHVLAWLQKRPRPVFVTRSRPYKKDDNAHVEQKNWTHVRQWFGYGRYGNPELVGALNALLRGPYDKLLNYRHASLKLVSKERDGTATRRRHDASTPVERALACGQTDEAAKKRLREEQGRINAFALKREVEDGLKQIEKLRLKNL